MKPYPLGKLPAADLQQLLKSYHPNDPRLLLGGKLGEDAAVIEMTDKYLIAKTDPITFATEKIGWYAVNVNANDVVCMGAIPKWFLATLLLPEYQTTPNLVKTIFQQITDACQDLNINLAGGHTEITHGLDHPIVVGLMLGEVDKNKLVLSSGVKVGDDLLLTKAIAIEGTAIIAHQKQADLAANYTEIELTRLQNLLHQPGISVIPEALTALEVGGVSAMHDPTEGGVATGLWELATAGEVGLEIFADKLPYHPDCLTLCELFDLNPLGLIASGSLLITINPDLTSVLKAQLNAMGIDVTLIGRVHPQEFGLKLVGQQGEYPLPTFERDEIAKLFE